MHKIGNVVPNILSISFTESWKIIFGVFIATQFALMTFVLQISVQKCIENLVTYAKIKTNPIHLKKSIRVFE